MDTRGKHLLFETEFTESDGATGRVQSGASLSIRLSLAWTRDLCDLISGEGGSREGRLSDPVVAWTNLVGQGFKVTRVAPQPPASSPAD